MAHLILLASTTHRIWLQTLEPDISECLRSTCSNHPSPLLAMDYKPSNYQPPVCECSANVPPAPLSLKLSLPLLLLVPQKPTRSKLARFLGQTSSPSSNTYGPIRPLSTR
ncbi:hypothetical protein LEMLEM_LOCUS27211 [Lemmus lemmus]